MTAETPMSRTIAHRPPWARLVDPALRHEHHDHRHGNCDLLPFAAWLAEDTDRYRRRCGWDTNWWATGPTCGCAMCTQRDWRRAERRRDRHRTRTLLRRGDWDTL